MKVGVIGCGYVGLVTAVGLTLRGHDVVAVDIDETRISQINQGKVPFHEPGIAEGLKICLQQKRLKASTKIESVKKCKVVFICVQTPPQKNGAINLQILEAACQNLLSIFTKYPMFRTIVIRSTVIPGTTDKFVTPIFQKKNSAKNHQTEIAVNPEFLREGSAFEDFLTPDRIVIGTNSEKARKLLAILYKPFDSTIIQTTPSTAELAKYTSNSLLATLISFSNEIARICEKTAGADIEDVLGIVHYDRRFKSLLNGILPPGILTYLKAGCGFGGSCLPKDLSALIAYANSVKEESLLLKAVENINNSQSIRIINMLKEALGDLRNKKISVLGVAFKGGTDDLRESPGLKIVDELLTRKVEVLIFDPLVNPLFIKGYEEKGAIIMPTLAEAVNSSDACIIASNAKEFHKLDNLCHKLKRHRMVIVDGRRILKIPKDKRQKYYAIGLSKVSASSSD